jgi:hypothetical protein
MPWNSPIIITLFTVGGVLGLSFIFVEGKIAKFPVIPGHVFKIRTVVSVYISIFFTGLLYFGEIYYLPIYLQVNYIAKLYMKDMLPLHFKIEIANVFHVGCQRSDCHWKWSSHDASSVSPSHSLLAFWVTDIQNRELPIYLDGWILYHDRGCR